MTQPSLAQLLAVATAQLAAAGVASPDWDAEELLAHALGLDRKQLRTRLVLHDAGSSGNAESLTAAQYDVFTTLVSRRVRREPLQHLTGEAAFRHVTLAVGPGVFVPRPETELLAGWAIEQARLCAEPVVLDLCTGSGAIAKAIANEVPQARVYAVELADEAHAWAQRNLAGTGVELRQGDLRTAFEELCGTVDVVVSNPPYVPLEAWESVAVEARDHDPQLALFAGQDGLELIRELAVRAARLLKAGGVAGTEHADVQGESVPAIFAATGDWQEIRDHLDLAGRPRYTTARLAR